MRIPSNRLRSVIGFIRQELLPYYDKEEIENFIFYLAEAYLGFSRTDMVTKSEDTMNESDLLKFNFAVKDLKKYKPIQYVLGSTEFYGLKFKLNSHVLIPRPETEELVDLIIKDTQKNSENRQISILDIGSGSGCIAISLKKNIPQAIVKALDISPEALILAADNTRENSVEIEFIQADILALPSDFIANFFDVIVSNPPYVCNSEKALMSKNVLDYEPHLALFVKDEDPLLFYKSIAEFALKNLNENGRLYFEINELFGKEIVKLLEGKGFNNIQVKNDLSGKDRMISCYK